MAPKERILGFVRIALCGLLGWSMACVRPRVEPMAPKPIVLGYWLGYESNGRSLKETPPEVDVVALAFGVTGPGNDIRTAFLCSGHPEQEIREGVRFLQARGQKVILSINGCTDWPDHPHGWENLDPKLFAANVKRLVQDDWGLDGIDLDNEADYRPRAAADGNFVQAIKELRKALGPKALITIPVYMGPKRDAFLAHVRDDIDYVFTMAYWNKAEAQLAMLKKYQKLVGPWKVGIGVAEAANPGQSTDFGILPELGRHRPKAGIMLWQLNSPLAPQWCRTIRENLH